MSGKSKGHHGSYTDFGRDHEVIPTYLEYHVHPNMVLVSLILAAFQMPSAWHAKERAYVSTVGASRITAVYGPNHISIARVSPKISLGEHLLRTYLKVMLAIIWDLVWRLYLRRGYLQGFFG